MTRSRTCNWSSAAKRVARPLLPGRRVPGTLRNSPSATWAPSRPAPQRPKTPCRPSLPGGSTSGRETLASYCRRWIRRTGTWMRVGDTNRRPAGTTPVEGGGERDRGRYLLPAGQAGADRAHHLAQVPTSTTLSEPVADTQMHVSHLPVAALDRTADSDLSIVPGGPGSHASISPCQRPGLVAAAETRHFRGACMASPASVMISSTVLHAG